VVEVQAQVPSCVTRRKWSRLPGSHARAQGRHARRALAYEARHATVERPDCVAKEDGLSVAASSRPILPARNQHRQDRPGLPASQTPSGSANRHTRSRFRAGPTSNAVKRPGEQRERGPGADIPARPTSRPSTSRRRRPA